MPHLGPVYQGTKNRKLACPHLLPDRVAIKGCRLVLLLFKASLMDADNVVLGVPPWGPAVWVRVQLLGQPVSW